MFLKRRFLFLLVIIALASGTATYFALHSLIRGQEPLKPLAETEETVPPDQANGEPGADDDPAAAGDGDSSAANNTVPAGGSGESNYFLGISNGYVAIYYGNQTDCEVSEITTIPASRLSPGDLNDINNGAYTSDSREDLRRLLEGLGN